MRAAVIDLGTNTFHLIIADLEDGLLNVIYKTNKPVKLGEGRINENMIIPEAFQRGLKTLKDFSETIAFYQVTLVKATATSAVRSAGNGAEFVEAVKSQTGLQIQVITGEEEASFIFSGVKATGVMKEASLIGQNSLIMDIGGGSTEFIICNGEKPLWKKSYNIGAARLMQAYFHSDPISTEDQRAIMEKITSELGSLRAACQEHQPTVLIGSAGAFETYATLLGNGPEPFATAFMKLDLDGYHELASQLILSTHAERENMHGLIPLRVDMIVIASILTSYIIKEFRMDSLFLSTYDLKMGILYELL
jgi:exopolyphosphatase/guanosine-5'-triphosphate,3'-diphosphate pyrophosphatase